MHPLTFHLDQDFALPVVATIAWFLVFGWFTVYQSFLAGGEIDSNPNMRFNYSDNRAWCIADRTVGNMLEQTPFFVSVVWMHALFIDARVAGILGCVATAFRFLYPMLRTITTMLMEFSTQPYYLCVLVLKANLIWKVLYGNAIVTDLSMASWPKMLQVWLVGLLIQVGGAFVIKLIMDKLGGVGGTGDGKPKKE
jgi:hypothetical protein